MESSYGINFENVKKFVRYLLCTVFFAAPALVATAHYGFGNPLALIFGGFVAILFMFTPFMSFLVSSCRFKNRFRLVLSGGLFFLSVFSFVVIFLLDRCSEVLISDVFFVAPAVSLVLFMVSLFGND